MSLGTDARDKPGTHAGVLLKEDRFDLITRILGCESDVARSRLLEMDPKTIYRARRGGVVGEEFIARVLHAMQRHSEQLAELGITPTFEEVFKVDVGRAE
jgi:hypothetical protein